MKLSKFIGYGYRKGKGGFTLIEVLIVLLILAIITAVVVMAVGGVFGQSDKTAYDITKEQIQRAVASYTANSGGSLPILNGTYTNADCSNCKVIDIKPLLVANGGMLQQVPTGIWLGNTSGMDNCNADSGLGCSNENSYIWLLDSTGNMYSYCAGAECDTNNSGKQGIWP